MHKHDPALDTVQSHTKKPLTNEAFPFLGSDAYAGPELRCRKPIVLAMTVIARYNSLLQYRDITRPLRSVNLS